MSTKEKQATPKAAFVFHVPLANEQPAKQAGKRVSAGSRANESTKEKTSDAEGGICFSRAISERAACEAGGEARQRGLESGRKHERKTSDAERNLIRQIGFINEQRRSF